ncbi:MAG: hypothetical protein GTO18_10795 [Anaerolineales bacterium]|nr:hypothetical protein [Anaerolineales bacterium]
MLDLYLFSLFTIVLTEYGFQTRRRAIDRFTGNWRWGRSLSRIILWILALLWWVWKGEWNWRLLIIIPVGMITGEIAVVLLRRSIKNEVQGHYPLTRPQTHLIPFVSALIPLALALLLTRYNLPATPLRLPNAPTSALGLLTSLVALFCWSTLMTVSFVGLVRTEEVKDVIEPYLGAGEVIGILERYLTFILVLAGGLAAVGFAVAAKAAARYPQFKNPAFAEYFLIGTLSSVGLATFAGLLLKWLQ